MLANVRNRKYRPRKSVLKLTVTKNLVSARRSSLWKLKNLQNPLISHCNLHRDSVVKSVNLEGFSTSRGSISKLRHDFWSRSVLKHIPQIYTFDSARFRTISVRSRDTATLFGLNLFRRFLNYIVSYVVTNGRC